MKTLQTLLELLNSKVGYEVVAAKASGFKARTEINGRTVMFFAEDNGESWDIVFSEVKGDRETFSLTGSGGSLQVLAFVQRALKEFIERYSPDVLSFTADSETRLRLYTKILKAVAPRYVLEVRKVGGEYHVTCSRMSA